MSLLNRLLVEVEKERELQLETVRSAFINECNRITAVYDGKRKAIIAAFDESPA